MCQLFSSGAFLVKLIWPSLFYEINGQFFLNVVLSCLLFPPAHLFLIGAGVLNRVSILLVRSLCIFSLIISTGVFLFKLFVGSPFQIAFKLTALSPLFFPESEPLFEHQFHSCGGSSVFPQLSQLVNSRQVHHGLSRFLFRWIQFQFSVLIVFFYLSQMLPLAHSPLTIYSFWIDQDISGDSSVFQLVRGCHLIQVFQSFRCIISHSTILSTVFSL